MMKTSLSQSPLHRRDSEPAAESPTAERSPSGTVIGGRQGTFFLLLPLAAAAMWSWSFLDADPRQMGSLGLLTLFSPLTILALVLLLAGFLLALYRALPDWLLAAYLAIYVLLVHGTPVLLYGTLRYSWAHKHVGIVDFIQRHGMVDPSIDVGQIYHNWPGFFAGSALLTEISGQTDALLIASWAPVVFNLINVVILRFVFRGLTRNRILIWLALMFFLLINWVGQDYFSPQAIGFILYLALIGLMLRPIPRRVMLAPFIVIVTSIAVSHQITPMMMLLAVSALVVLRRTDGWYLPIVALAIVGTWAFTGARDYTIPNLLDLVSEFGNVVDNADQTLEKTNSSEGLDLLVVWGGRSTVIVAVLASLIGIWRGWSHGGSFAHPGGPVLWRGFGRRREWTGTSPRVTAVVLMILPGVLVLTTGFGGEVLFRAFLFASPFIAILAAEACLSHTSRGFPRRSVLLAAAVMATITPGFLLGYYGKEQQNYFSSEEVAVSRWLYTNAKPGSLLVEGSPNYPTRFVDYEKFTYVPIDREPEESTAAILADPVGKMTAWLSNPKYTDGYVLICRGQKMAVDSGGSMPPGSLDRIEDALLRSGNFTVLFQTRDATVFTLSEQGREK